MTGEIAFNFNLLMADADRERAVARLHTAVGEGRLTLNEFEDRMSGVLAARTFADVTPFLVDLPEPAEMADPLELTARGSSIVRTGRWAVPARMRVKASGSSVVLNFIEAQLPSNIVRIDVEFRGSTLRMVVPEGSTVDAGAVSMAGSTVRARRLSSQAANGATHYVITGELKGSTIKVAPPVRWFWRRRPRRS